MRFYKELHKYYCGIDLHAKKMYVCIVDEVGEIVLHKNIDCNADRFLRLIAPYRDNLVVGVECMFCWYWLADLCEREDIKFILGHALYMKAVSGGKAQNDKIDSERIARLIKSGMFPMSFVYPSNMRATRDLMRRRLYFVNKRAELLAHLRMTHQQYNINVTGKKLRFKCNREGLTSSFEDASIRQMIETESTLVDHYNKEIYKLETHIKNAAKSDATNRILYSVLKTFPGIGDVLALTILYEIYDISRFPTVGKFASYARLVKPKKTSAGKSKGGGGSKVGNRHLKWAFSEAAILMIRNSEAGKQVLARFQKKRSKAKSLSCLAHKIGRSIYFMMEKKSCYDEDKFLTC